MRWFCQKSRFQFLAVKMVGNPKTPGISPDTPDLEHSGEKLRVLIRILRKFRIEVRIFRVCRIEDVGLSRVVVRVYGLGLFQSTNHTAYILMSYVYVLTPPSKEPCTRWSPGHRSSGGKFSRRIVSSRPKAQLSPVPSSSPKASPGAHPIIWNYDTYICIYYLCITFRNWLEP